MPTDVHLYLPPPTTSGQHREAHAYGPETDTFHTDLGIEINPALIADNHALAVVNGLIRVIRDPSPATTATLVLQPSPAAASALTSVVGSSVVVFVYRNVDVPSLRIRFQPRIEAMGDEPFASSEPLLDRVDHFIDGEYGVFVHGGDALGALSSSGGTDGWGQLRFEIAYLPGGLSGPHGWTRLQALVAPANERTRRLDPMAFYRGVETGTMTVRLAPAHAGHLLLTLPTRRVLLEVRDEYDAPVVGSVDVTSSSTGATTSVALPAGARGTTVLATAPSSGAPPSATYTIATTDQIFTDLPSGGSPAAMPSQALTAAAHWSVQRIFMADVNDPANWFVANAARMPRFTSGNRVTPIIDGIPAFAQMVAAMSTVIGAGHYIRLAGWWCTDSFQMIPGGTGTSFHEQTTRMADAGAEVRAMLWDQWFGQNSDEVDHINALPGGHGRAILDTETISSSHHQKLLVVNGSGGALAFCGGVDINPDRLDNPSHRAASPFHDLHARVEGPAVADINRTFVQRWNSHSSTPPVLSWIDPPFAAAPSTHYVQVSRTFAPSRGYGFVSRRGDLGTLNAVRRAIQRAQRFIYIEDQYLTPYAGPFPYSASADKVGILSDLMAALRRSMFEYLIVVIPNNTDLWQNRYRRRNFIRPLRDAFPTKVFPFYLVRARSDGGTPAVSSTAAADQNLDPGRSGSGGSSASGGPERPAEIYVHAKVWLVDDVYVKIGSSNCNRRSMTNDTEIDVHVIDGALSSGARRIARQLRLDLWGEHLNLAGGGRSVTLEDPTHALTFWQHPPAGAHIRPYDENADLEIIHTDTSWDNALDPEGRGSA
jgi:phosphatidylserine/phosphatidylglycerophosphate/cardiolipin synthase-like enzyme